MPQMTLDIDSTKVRAMLAGAASANFDPEPAWLKTEQYLRVRTSAMFANIRSVVTGGTYRGVTWAGMKPQYTRKDGTVIPAWGGVERVRAGWRKGRTGDAARPGLRSTGERMTQVRGVVAGRLRPSGTRVKRTSTLLQDTMHMRKTATTVIRHDRTLLMLGPQGVNYAAAQDEMRPFLFFEIPEDADAIAGFFADSIERAAQGGPGANG